MREGEGETYPPPLLVNISGNNKGENSRPCHPVPARVTLFIIFNLDATIPYHSSWTREWFPSSIPFSTKLYAEGKSFLRFGTSTFSPLLSYFLSFIIHLTVSFVLYSSCPL